MVVEAMEMFLPSLVIVVMRVLTMILMMVVGDDTVGVNRIVGVDGRGGKVLQIGALRNRLHVVYYYRHRTTKPHTLLHTFSKA
jgi:hypothetical protein